MEFCTFCYADVTKAFGLPVGKYDPSNDSNEVSRESNTQVDKQRISTRICTGSTKEPVNRKKDDDHNEVCEVCEKGGDLLCCDTCTLVFHLGCIRPKISTIPKGKWSCAHCISDVSRAESGTNNQNKSISYFLPNCSSIRVSVLVTVRVLRKH